MPSTEVATHACPECGNPLQPRMLRCRNCGHVFGKRDRAPDSHTEGAAELQNGTAGKRPQGRVAHQLPGPTVAADSADGNQATDGTIIGDILNLAGASEAGASEPPEPHPPHFVQPSAPQLVVPAPAAPSPAGRPINARQPTATPPKPAHSPPPPSPQSATEATGGVDIADIVDRAAAGADVQAHTIEPTSNEQRTSPELDDALPKLSLSGRYVRPPSVGKASRSAGQATDDTRPGLDRETTLPPAHRKESADVIWLTCQCGRRMRAQRALSGKRVKCRRCGGAVVVPEEAAGASGVNTGPSGISFAQMAERLKSEPGKPVPADESAARPVLSRARFRKLSKVISRADRCTADDVTRFKEAIEELGGSNDPRAADVLLPLLQDEHTVLRPAAVEALGALGDPRAVPPLVALLDAEDATLRRAVCKALGQIGDRRAVRPLLVLGLSDPHARLPASEAIVAMGEAAIGVLLDLLNDDDPGMVLEAVVLLGRLKAKKAVKALVMVLETRSSPFRAHAAEALGMIEDPRAAGPLCRLLGDPDVGVRVNATAALSKLADPQTFKPLLVALNDDDLDVRRHAAVALGEVGDRQAVPMLCELLATPYLNLRIAAAEALGKLGDPGAVEPLVALLREENDELVVKAAAALKKLNDPRAAGALVDVLYHPNPSIRQRAADSLGSIGDALVVEHLETLLKVDRSPEVRVAAAKALGEIGDPASMATLEEALRDEFAVRCRAIVALGLIGNEASLPALMAMLRDQQPEVRYHAAGALAEINHQNAIEPLQQALSTEDNAMARRGMEKALEKLSATRTVKAAAVKTIKKRPRQRPTASLRKLLGWFVPTQLAFLVPQTSRGWIIASVLVLTGPAGYGLFVFGAWLVPKDRVVPRGRVSVLAFSPDGNLVSVGRSLGLVEIWNVEDGDLDQKIASDFPVVKGIAFGHDAQTLFVAAGASLQLWKARGSEKVDLQGHQSDIVFIRASADGARVMTQGSDGTLFFWDPQVDGFPDAIGLDTQDLTAVAVNGDGTLAAAGDGKGNLGIWNNRAERLHKYSGARGSIDAIAISPETKLIAAGVRGGVIEIWDVESEQHLHTLKSATPTLCSALHFLGGPNRLAAVWGGAKAEVWNLAGDAEVQEFDVASEAEVVTTIAFSPDGKWLALGGEQNTQFWVYDLASATLKHVLNVPN